MAFEGIGPIGPARFGFDHDASDSDRERSEILSGQKE